MSDSFTPTRLVLVRHGESQVTVRRVIGGPRTCSGPSDLGRRQARALHDRLASTGELTPTVLLGSNWHGMASSAQPVGASSVTV